jgi:ribulose-phosphate 3-epimerase
MGLVVPAVLPSSKQELEEGLELFSRIPSVSRVQVDVVDGKFVSPASWPFSAEATNGTLTELEAMVQKGEMLPNLDHFEYEIDLMCFDAERVAEAWLALGATRLIFHAESTTDLPRLLASARKRYGANGFASLVSFGLALNIAGDLALIEPCLDDIEFVQFMGIAQIGRQGQPFDNRVFEKVRIFKSRHPEIPLQVDGGISFDSAKELVALGVSNIVIGSNILRATDPAAAVAAFEELQSPYGV